MKLLHTGQDRILFDRIKQALNQAEIAFMVRNENPVGQAAGEVPPVVCWPEIYISDMARFEKAKALVEMLKPTSKTSALTWICPGCGERLEPQFQLCWACEMPPEEG